MSIKPIIIIKINLQNALHFSQHPVVLRFWYNNIIDNEKEKNNMEILFNIGVLLIVGIFVLVVLKKINNSNQNEKQESLLREIADLKSKIEVSNFEKNHLLEEKQQLITERENLVKACELQFENTANKIFNQQTTTLKENNKAELKNIVDQLKQNLEKFKQKLESEALRQTSDKENLNNQIQKVCDVNLQIQNTTKNFIDAIRGKAIVRGTWGEDTVTKLLTDMGFKENINFFKQVFEEGKRPDFIILLPNGQVVILDAKTIFDKYYDYTQTINKIEEEQFLKEHISNIKNTIKSLHSKKYQKDIETFCNKIGAKIPDEPISLVLMFINPESALTCVIEKEPDIIQEAKNNKVALVTLSTLVSTLQIINSLWNSHNIQEENQKIKEYAEILINDFSEFLKNYINLRKHLDSALNTYTESINIVGENNERGLIHTAQQLANIIPVNDIPAKTKEVIRKATGFYGSKKI